MKKYLVKNLIKVFFKRKGELFMANCSCFFTAGGIRRSPATSETPYISLYFISLSLINESVTT